jgi:ribosomal protein L10
LVNIINQMVSRDLAGMLDGAEGMLFVTYAGLTVAEDEALRTKLDEHGLRLRMVRNSLLRRLLAEQGVELDAATLIGNTGLVTCSTEDVINAAKTFSDGDFKALRKQGKIAIKAAFFEGEVMGSDGAIALADLPDRDTVNAMLLAVISGPARGLASVINAVPSGLARVLQAHVDSQDDA